LYGLEQKAIDVPGTLEQYNNYDGELKTKFMRSELFPSESIITTLKKLLLIEKAKAETVSVETNSIQSEKNEGNSMKKLPSRKVIKKAKPALSKLLKKAKTVAAPAADEEESDPFETYEDNEEEQEAPKAKTARRLPGRKAPTETAMPINDDKAIEELKAMIKAQSLTISSLVVAVNSSNNKADQALKELKSIQEQLAAFDNDDEEEADEEVFAAEIEEAATPKAKRKAPKKSNGEKQLSEAAQEAVDLAQAMNDSEEEEVTFTIEMLVEYRGMEMRSAGPVKRSVNSLVKDKILEAYDMDGVEEYGLPGLAD